MGVSLFRSISNQYEHLRSVNTVPMMNAISHQIETQVINHRMPVSFYAGFQRFSRFPAQQRFYQQLGTVCRRVYVFGVPDVKAPNIPGIEFVAIDPTSPLAREWFLVVDTPEFWTVLSTQETSGHDTIGGGRRYDGLWTYDQQVVERAALLISQELGSVYTPIRQRNYETQSRHIAEISGRMVERYEQSRLVSRRRWARMMTLQQVAETLSKNPAAAHGQQVASLMQSLFGAEEAVIAIQQQGEQYAIVTSEDSASSKPRTLRASDGVTWQAISAGAPVRVDDVRRDRVRDALLPAAQSLMSTPIVGQQRIYGALTVSGGEANQWTDEDAQTLMGVASLLALAIERGGDVPADVTAQLERAKRLEQAVINLRKPLASLLEWEQQLRDEAGSLQPSISFLESLAQVENLTAQLAQTIGVSRTVAPEFGVHKPLK